MIWSTSACTSMRTFWQQWGVWAVAATAPRANGSTCRAAELRSTMAEEVLDERFKLRRNLVHCPGVTARMRMHVACHRDQSHGHADARGCFSPVSWLWIVPFTLPIHHPDAAGPDLGL